jgi:hypothetical protein
MLAVAGMGDDEPRLIDTKPVARAKGKVSRETKEEPKEEAKPAGKPRVRLVNGELKKIDDGPRLF